MKLTVTKKKGSPIPVRVVRLCGSKSSGSPSWELQPSVNAWMLIKECKFHVSGPRLTHSGPPGSMRAGWRERHTQRFWRLIIQIWMHSHKTEGPNQPRSPPLFGMIEIRVNQVDDLKGVKLRGLIIQKFHIHRNVYQYAKRRHKVGQNIGESL